MLLAVKHFNTAAETFWQHVMVCPSFGDKALQMYQKVLSVFSSNNSQQIFEKRKTRIKIWSYLY